ncbi:MAG TPA: carboxymuconolactone decarboxylase family protein [Actinomycetota bacterium]|nr:carboxymuconolactone decarboxylase family protein [Actinomycetota bacterium]
MSRLPLPDRDALDGPGRELFDHITQLRDERFISADGILAGPDIAWVNAPAIGLRLISLARALRFEVSIDLRLIEVAIITTGAHHRAEFAWFTHARMAREQGVSDAVIDAIREGRTPDFERDDERIVHAVATELASGSWIDAATYDDAQRLLGDQGIVELVELCGFYALVSYVLNAFEVPLPAGAEQVFGD